ncbi:hypothetical protein H0G86_002720 [Trichoderma simmonsii]|uniref:Uncharacterized protein n=1 Tax=Trichoderma simmonsii TaxID=1491479 RepID=A0A8G0PDQ0_9HYPO|nr:hypothetical protein H0G86_002720 [Trichoderma simmonsii]
MQTDPDEEAPGQRLSRGVRDSPAQHQLAPIKKLRNPSSGQLGPRRTSGAVASSPAKLGPRLEGPEGLEGLQGQNLFPKASTTTWGTWGNGTHQQASFKQVLALLPPRVRVHIGHGSRSVPIKASPFISKYEDILCTKCLHTDATNAFKRRIHSRSGFFFPKLSSVPVRSWPRHASYALLFILFSFQNLFGSNWIAFENLKDPLT